MSNTFGRWLRVATFGESHGAALGAVVDGAPPRLALSAEDFDVELARRRPGQSALVTQRKEEDKAEILSGLVDGKTLGTPIAVLVRNHDARSEAYDEMKVAYRPSHADYTYDAKYGIRAVAGGGRASARETIGRIIGGVVARKILASFAPIEITAYVQQVHDVIAEIDPATVTRAQVESNAVRCPDAATAEIMAKRIEATRAEGDSVGGTIGCVVRGVPAGWGAPVFGKLEADLAAGLLSIPAVRGFEIGSGFSSARMKGSEHNDPFLAHNGRIGTATNRSGGVQGGISNGEPILLTVAVKPTATIAREQQTVDRNGNPATLAARGRHDACVLPRAVPIVEAMVALVLADAALQHRGQCG